MPDIIILLFNSSNDIWILPFFQIAYDDLFFDTVGRDITKAWSNIQKIFVHVQAAFCHASLGTKIHVDIGNSAHHIENLRTEFSFAQDYADNVVDPILRPLTEEMFENDSNVNLVVYLTNNEGTASQKEIHPPIT